MKRTFIILTSLIIIIGLIFLLSKETSQNNLGITLDTDDSVQKQIKPSEEIKSANGQLIDVREPEEYEESHADNAINIPLGRILESDFSLIDINKPIYVYCRSGNRSNQAKTALEQAGYKNVIDLGGLNTWIEQGGKVCSASNPSC